MSADDPDITDPIDVAKLAFSAEDGVILDELGLTWQSYVDIADDGTITVDVYPDTNPMGEHEGKGFRYRIEYLGPAPEGPTANP